MAGSCQYVGVVSSFLPAQGKWLCSASKQQLQRAQYLYTPAAVTAAKAQAVVPLVSQYLQVQQPPYYADWTSWASVSAGS